MSAYGWVLVLSLLGPLLFSFHSKVRFYQKWKAAFVASLIVAIPFWIWDSLATSRGDWSFNSGMVSEISIFGLPVEEMLFFIVIPFCCLFLWELLGFISSNDDARLNSLVMYVMMFVFLVGGWWFRDKYYTLTILLWSFCTLALIKVFGMSELLKSKRYWWWIGITFLPFLIVNGVLTSIPVVSYSEKAILGYRVGTIPIEDFLYSWSMLTLNLLVYQRLISVENKPNIQK